ncbi:MAG: hypothetical protein H7A05_11435 [Pseudomonadales bacterium]|nr:hypothetical protein [Pseudomonadales bacterium]
MNEPLDLKAEIARIPSDYQEMFREALRQEVRAAGKDQTDGDILAYLRQRAAEFAEGDYIQPDGKAAAVFLSKEQMYDKAMGAIARDVVGAAADGQERRMLFIKLGGLVLLLVLLITFAFAGRHSRAEVVAVTPTAAAETTTGLLPTPTLLASGGTDAALQTIGGLGGSLTLGRPSALEIRYVASEKVVALPIDPARVSSKGELPYDAVRMRSDNPVAVWVFGTVLNYALGLPPNLVAALQAGDRVQVHTDTGATLSFVIVSTETRANYETNALLSQDRVGATLFALPAPDATAVPVALAGYDLAAEDAQTAVYQAPDAPFGADNSLQLATVTFAHTEGGDLTVTVVGRGPGVGTLALHGGSQQTTAAAMPATDPWQVIFTLPGEMAGEGLTAVYRHPLTGDAAFIRLGSVPDLLEQVEPGTPTAIWQPEEGRIVVTMTMTNPGPGQVLIPADYIQQPNPEGGDVYRQILLEETMIAAGETRQLTVSFPHADPEVSALLQIGKWLWRIDALTRTDAP